MNEIILKDKKGSRVFSGREEGKSSRSFHDLDNKDKDDNNYKIVFPNNVLALNTSFFLGMFGNSVRYLGKERFLEKYQFDTKSAIIRSVENGIIRAMKSSDPLS